MLSQQPKPDSDSQSGKSDAEASDGGSTAKVPSTDAASEMSAEEDAEDALLDVVDPQKQWTTVKDRAGRSIVLLPAQLRHHPLLPPCLSNPDNSFLDVDNCYAFPRAHCAFKGCPWTSESKQCQPRSCHEDVWAVSDGSRYRHLRRVEARPGIFGCCGQSTCLREHVSQSRGKVLGVALPADAVSEQSFDSYLEAIAYKEQEKMPDVGPAIDEVWRIAC